MGLTSGSTGPSGTAAPDLQSCVSRFALHLCSPTNRGQLRSDGPCQPVLVEDEERVVEEAAEVLRIISVVVERLGDRGPLVGGRENGERGSIAGGCDEELALPDLAHRPAERQALEKPLPALVDVVGGQVNDGPAAAGQLVHLTVNRARHESGVVVRQVVHRVVSPLRVERREHRSRQGSRPARWCPAAFEGGLRSQPGAAVDGAQRRHDHVGDQVLGQHLEHLGEKLVVVHLLSVARH